MEEERKDSFSEEVNEETEDTKESKRKSLLITYVDKENKERIVSYTGLSILIPENGDLLEFDDKLYTVRQKLFSHSIVDEQIFIHIVIYVESIKESV